MTLDATLSQLLDTLVEQHQRLLGQDQELARLSQENAALRTQLADLHTAYELARAPAEPTVDA